MSKKIEKERKWLLAKIPTEAFDYPALHIEQFYTEDGWRYRRTNILDSGDIKYEKLRKISIDKGINHEIDIEQIDEVEYDKKAYDNSDCHFPFIAKIRYVIPYNGKTLEIDEFDNINLCILEIEDVEVEEDIQLPDWVKKYVIMEVTGIESFSNKNLAQKDEL